MSRTLPIALAVAAMTVVILLVLNAPKRPGVDPTETSAVQLE